MAKHSHWLKNSLRMGGRHSLTRVVLTPRLHPAPLPTHRGISMQQNPRCGLCFSSHSLFGPLASLSTMFLLLQRSDSYMSPLIPTPRAISEPLPSSAAPPAAQACAARYSLPIMRSRSKGLSILVLGVSSLGISCLLLLGAAGAAGCTARQGWVVVSGGRGRGWCRHGQGAVRVVDSACVV